MTHFVKGLVEAKTDLGAFKNHLRDFLVQSKEFSDKVSRCLPACLPARPPACLLGACGTCGYNGGMRWGSYREHRKSLLCDMVMRMKWEGEWRVEDWDVGWEVGHVGADSALQREWRE